MTKSEMAYLIGTMQAYNVVSISYQYFTKEEVKQEYERLLKLKEQKGGKK